MDPQCKRRDCILGKTKVKDDEFWCKVRRQEERGMKRKALIAYFAILLALCTGFVVGARVLGKSGVYLAQGYMLTPAIAAIITRLFFYPPRFKDANLRFGRVRDYLKVWLLALGITVLSFGLYTLFGAIEWDLSGSSFLSSLEEQFALSGQDMVDTLPPGFTPEMMLLVFTLGGLTFFNIMPGLISGFGEEFGHRGFMFPQLFRLNPWIGLVGGGLIWYAWHLPLALILPSQGSQPMDLAILNHIVLGIGSVSTFVYLSYVYVKSRSIFVTSIAHIALNNAAAALSYYVIVRDQLLANVGLTLTMMAVVTFLYLSKELRRSFEHELPEMNRLNRSPIHSAKSSGKSFHVT
jgi:membrane protease YdiL (CAAX protease family)